MGEQDRAMDDGRGPAAITADLVALARSVVNYHGDQSRCRAMDRLYSAFVGPGTLAFDVGAHVGDRTASFRRLEASVVAVEPQLGPLAVIGSIFKGDPKVILVPAAVGAQAGQARLRINSRNPTVSTLSSPLIQAASGQEGWAGERWDFNVDVPLTTLDLLIAAHGLPAFIKLDVEGSEAEALSGLSSPVAALSFEFTTLLPTVARAAIARLSILGPYVFNFALGESQELELDHWLPAADITAIVTGLPKSANSGDVYAQIRPEM